MGQYKILYYDDKECYVIIKVATNPGSVIKEFIKFEMSNTKYNGIIIFDSLLSSISPTNKKRFFCYKCVDGKIDFNNQLKNIKIKKKYLDKSDEFFLLNKNLLSNSFLLNKYK